MTVCKETTDCRMEIFLCPICMEVLNEAVHLVGCRHDFCECCLKKWFEQNQTCPLCRMNASINDMRPSFILRMIMRFDKCRVVQRADNTEQGRLSNLKETILILANGTHTVDAGKRA